MSESIRTAQQHRNIDSHLNIMKTLFFESITTLQFSASVVDHHFLLRVLPPSFGGQNITTAQLQLTPDIPYQIGVDGFGNLCETGCALFPHNEFIYSVSGTAQIDDTLREQEALHPMYKFPSFYTYTNEEMRTFASNLRLQGSIQAQALQLSDAIFHYMKYQPGVTCTNTTAIQAFTAKQGVCQDYAHIFIAMARFLGIPARYANGLPIGHGPSHAWIEIYTDGIWIGMDPTHNRLVGEDYIRFCIGRDFLDCALERGVFTGYTTQIQTSFNQVIER